MGSLVPCRRTSAGTRCVRIYAASGAALGLTAGAVLGQAGSAALAPVARGAAYGTLAGAVAGVGLRTLLARSQWLDVVALAAVGGAVGAAPVGSSIGLVAGTAVGLVLWKTQASFKLPDVVGAGLSGMAAGALFEWFSQATEANAEPVRVLDIRIPMGWPR
ncbi:MAG: hypothetical protein ACC682_11170 [Gemmatimonadota bacterium]